MSLVRALLDALVRRAPRRLDVAGRRYAARRCAKCNDPENSLVWVMAIEYPGFGDFVHPQNTFLHYYRCTVCNYDWQFASPLHDPDQPLPPRLS